VTTAQVPEPPEPQAAADEDKPIPKPTLKIVPPPQDGDPIATNANILLYGPPKIGKSTAAASAPPRVLYANCDLPNAMLNPRKMYGANVDEVRVEGLQTLVDITNAIKAGLRDGDLPWKTLVVDPMHDLYRILVEDLSDRAARPSLPLIGDAQTHIERFCRQMCELPINTVFVAHETSTKNEVAGSVEAIPFSGTTNDRPAGKLMGMVDIIGYCGVVEVEGQVSYQAQIVAANGRRAGDRFDALGKVRSLDLGEWFRLITDSQATEQQDNNNEAPQQVQKGAKA
jgi:hypothetical protein